MKRFTYALVCAAMTAAFTAPLASCSNDIDAVESVDYDGEGITVCSFPSFTTDGSTRAVDGRNDKTAWDESDVIYVQVNGEGSWYTLTYADGKWTAPEGFSIAKCDTYKAVYAPNYEPNTAKDALALKSGATASTAEYLTCEGKRPIYINFEREYSRLRVYVGESASGVTVEFGEGFTSNDGKNVSSFTLTSDSYGNAYVYGSWGEKTILTRGRLVSGDPSTGTYVGTFAMDTISTASVAGKAYATQLSTDDEIWVIHNLNNTKNSVSDWSSYSGYTKLKVVGTWDEAKAPGIYSVFTHVDLNSVIGLEAIPANYFMSNTTITRVDLPKTVKIINGAAFWGCSNLKELNLPDSITTINRCAFWGCSSLTINKMPKSTTTLEFNIFYGCTIAFKSMPNVTSIGDGIFYMCKFDGDGSFEWPCQITKIPEKTFFNSTLQSITIPKEVTEIGYYAFENCANLKTVTCKCEIVPTIDSSFDGINNDATLYIPTGSKDSYTNAGWGKYFTNIIETDFSE